MFLNRGRKLHTTRSWGFMMLEKEGGYVPEMSLWEKARYGEHTIIANLDTGLLHFLFFTFYLQFSLLCIFFFFLEEHFIM